jgi:phosphatidate cytidylyltransferase
MLTELWRQKKNPIFNAAIYVLGALYVALPFYWITSINFKDTMPFYYGYDVSSIGEVYDPTADFFPVILVLFILVWTNDTFAYLTGKFFGRKKLFERISPNKTWEGTLGGIMFTVIAGTLFHLFVNTETYPYFWILTPLIVAPAAILGDLFQSMMKRSLNIKDSGNIIPGHGGILDRFDAMIFTIPFYIAWVSLYPSLYKLFTA